MQKIKRICSANPSRFTSLGSLVRATVLPPFGLTGLKYSIHKIMSRELEIDLRSRGIADQQNLPSHMLDGTENVKRCQPLLGICRHVPPHTCFFM